MKFAEKMMLVPAGRLPLEVSSLTELDQAMTNVINNKSLSTLEKINLYSRILKKNLLIEERLKGKSAEARVRETQSDIKNEPTIEKMDIKIENASTPDLVDEVKTDIKKENDMDINVNDINLRKVLSSPNFTEIVKKNVSLDNPENHRLLDKETTKKSDKTPINPPINWEKIPYNLRNKSISYEHIYPQQNYTNVGTSFYSPKETDINGKKSITLNNRRKS